MVVVGVFVPGSPKFKTTPREKMLEKPRQKMDTRVLPVLSHAVMPARLFSIHSTAVWSRNASL